MIIISSAIISITMIISTITIIYYICYFLLSSFFLYQFDAYFNYLTVLVKKLYVLMQYCIYTMIRSRPYVCIQN